MVHTNKITPAPGSDCAKCVLYIEKGGTCPAFYPDQVPEEILNGETTHRKPVAGQVLPEVVFDMKSECRYPSL
jgi:hypothetical protein